MSQGDDFSIDGIIKKYESRQQELTHQLKHQKYCRTVEKELGEPSRSEVSTPEFNSTIDRKGLARQLNFEASQARTHKKQERREGEGEAAEVTFRLNSERKDYEKVLRQLDQTEERLARSEKNYAEVWRKYERLLRER